MRYITLKPQNPEMLYYLKLVIVGGQKRSISDNSPSITPLARIRTEKILYIGDDGLSDIIGTVLVQIKEIRIRSNDL